MKRNKTKSYVDLRPHEIAIITGWPIQKVFRLLNKKRIPARKVEQDGKIQYFVSPKAFEKWAAMKDLTIGCSGRQFLNDKIAIEEERLVREKEDRDRYAHEQMVRTAQRVEEHFRNLSRQSAA